MDDTDLKASAHHALQRDYHNYMDGSEICANKEEMELE